MTQEILIGIAGGLLSLFFSYVPKVKNWFEALEGIYKRLVMLAALAFAAIGVFGYSCLGQTGAVTCDADGAWVLLTLFAKAVIANQTTYSLTQKTKN